MLDRKYSNATNARRTVETPNMHKHSNDAVDINENEAHSPCKNLEGWPICSPQKISISRACEACETKLGCVLSYLENAITLVSTFDDFLRAMQSMPLVFENDFLPLILFFLFIYQFPYFLFPSQ